MAERLSRLEGILNEIQGGSLTTYYCEEILKVLDDKNVKPQITQKLLEICIRDPKDDAKYVTETLNIVSVILMKVAAGEFTLKPNLVPSLLGTLHVIKTSVYNISSEEIKLQYFKILTSYPDDVYLHLDEDCELLELFDLYCHPRIPIELRSQPFNVLLKYLKVLPPDKRLQFVKKGINTWLLKLVPSVMSFVIMKDFEIETSLQALEIVTNEFLHFDYFDNPNWKGILHCFYEPQKYPAVMKNLLIKGSGIWHRLWAVFIKMLKHQITKSSPSGSPINSMLPVVETAFKMDITNRCRAFNCWNVLIDNFATETNEVYIHKRIKLLVIPLYSNNAKYEDTIIAKLKTWWHLICGYYSKINNFADMILIPFLQFCFGKTNGNKPLPAQALLTTKTTKHCVETFVNIFGHHNCDGCVSLPKFKDKIINEKSLLHSRKFLIYTMSEAIRIVATSQNELRQPYKCAWISFMKLICDLHDDNVRRDFFNEVLAMLESLIKVCNAEALPDIIVSDLIVRLFNEDIQIMRFLNPTGAPSGVLHKIVTIVLCPSFDSMFSRYGMSEAVNSIKPVIEFIFEYFLHTSIVDDLAKQMTVNYKSMVLWTAMASTICEKKHDVSPQMLYKMLLWPIKHLDLFTNEDTSTSVWLKLLDVGHSKGNAQTIHDEITEVVKDSGNIKEGNSLFFLEVSVVILIHKMKAEKGIEFEKEVLLVREACMKIHSLKHKSSVLSEIMEIIEVLFKKLVKDVSLNIAKQVFMTLKIAFTLLLPTLKNPNEVNSELITKVDLVLKSINDLIKLEAYASLKEPVLSELKESAQCFVQHPILKDTLLSTLQIFLISVEENNPLLNIIKNLLDLSKQPLVPTIANDIPKFTTPSTPANKNAKKKETSIVNTVVENGEEFVVVKSNWKFNPKRLTDHQKEKLQRKREDIPALYQDLSQSQDDFKLNTWKTDSQDTTTTTSSSKSNDLMTNEKVSSILKNIPNTDVVPKILETILSENNQKRNADTETSNVIINKNETPTRKEHKSKLALKDRIFRNVRNLIEKSNVHNGEKQVKSSNDDITTPPQTPVGMSIRMSENVFNSAPLEMNSERPSRVKRKPKKFEEMQLISVKKRRHSMDNNEPQNRESFENFNKNQEVNETSKVEKDLSMYLENKKKQKSTDLVKGEIKNDADIDGLNKNDLNEQKDKPNGFQDDRQQPLSKSSIVREKSQIDMNNDGSVAMGNSLADTLENKEQLDLHETNSIQNESNKKKVKRKSRIEKELAIDMVEGHPFLKIQSEKRLTRKKLSESPLASKRKSSAQKVNKSKTNEPETSTGNKELKETDKMFDKSIILDTFPNTQESQDGNGSQDIIESSQDSTVSILSVKSSRTVKRVPVVSLENINDLVVNINKSRSEETNKAEDCTKILDKIDDYSVTSNCEHKDDSEFPRNKTAIDHIAIDLTENLDTEPTESLISDAVIAINNKEKADTTIDLTDTYVDGDTQDIADIDTQPVDSNISLNIEAVTNTPNEETQSLDAEKILDHEIASESSINASVIQTQDEITRTLTDTLLSATDPKQCENSSTTTTLEEEEQRKQDFFDNTLEISPIKPLSPVRENKSPSPETSSDYVVIKLSSPVQSNGEPFEKCDSPEIFTDDKVSPDKRDQSPPRGDIQVTTASPKSLSLKKSKPQVRSGGRAAQMLGLCVPATDRIQTIMNSEKPTDLEDVKKCSPLNSTARRNLRILYNSTNDNNETTEESDESKSFLKMNRSLPAVDSSPAVPILKRKLVDIIDDSTVSPASKRKRVSFHDPPVSTTICVKKYIEPSGVRSPQSSGAKRQEKQLRSQLAIGLKSQKRLDTVFKLDTALTKAVESFSDGNVTPSANEDTEMSSLEPTPLAEIVKNCELNDVDPICVDLIDCKDPIENIAGDLSSSAMGSLLVKEFAGKIETVGDLAKMSELEVNRLCIKAPKIQVARNVLIEYAKKLNIIKNEMTPMTEAAFSESSVVNTAVVDVAMQTDFVTTDSVKVQTEFLNTSSVSTQSNAVSTVDSIIQTDESGSRSTKDIVTSLMEKTDFCEHLSELLDVPSKQRIASSLPQSALSDTFVHKIDHKNLDDIIDRLLLKHASDSPNGRNDNQRLSTMRDYLTQRFSSKDLILLCSDLLKKVYCKNS